MINEYLVVGCFLVELVKFFKTATKLLLFFYPRKKKRIIFYFFYFFLLFEQLRTLFCQIIPKITLFSNP